MKRMMGLVGYFSICFLFLFSHSAFAYLDPTITTYVIQAVAGIAIVIGTFVALYWNKAKKKIQKKLNIDENSKKEMEDDIIVNDGVVAPEQDSNSKQ